ncbi:hypothetical protein QCA50_010812 [Cerrena zonata]|uniref:Uncharacterized protein n=1 Tax=Cerrena zonata TaxID=2478898 RepID=A0AAW0FYG6_9APHY
MELKAEVSRRHDESESLAWFIRGGCQSATVNLLYVFAPRLLLVIPHLTGYHTTTCVARNPHTNHPISQCLDSLSKLDARSSKKTGPTIVFDIVPHHGNPIASSDIMVKTAKTHHYRQKAYLVPFSSREHDMILTQSKIKAFETHETVGRRHDKIPLASLEPVERED